MKKILVLMVFAFPLVVIPTAIRMDVDEHSSVTVLNVSGGVEQLAPSHAAAGSLHGDNGIECCHAYCICCTAQGTLVGLRLNISPLQASRAPEIKRANFLPNPHLAGLLRPPIIG